MASLALAGCCPYEALCISQHASHEEVASAYRRLAVQSHPDKGGTADMFRKVNEAYGVLKHADSRSFYNSHYHLTTNFALKHIYNKKNQEAEERTDAEEKSRILSQMQSSFQGPQAKAKAEANAKTEPRRESDADYANRMHREYQAWKREETRKEELREKGRNKLREKAHVEFVAKEQAAKEKKRAHIAIAQSKQRSKKNRTQEKAAQEAVVKAGFKAVMKQLKDRCGLLTLLSNPESLKTECERKAQMLHRKVLACEKLDATTKPSDRNKQQKEKIQSWKDFKYELSKCNDQLSKYKGESELINERLQQLTVSGVSTPSISQANQ